MMKNMQLFKKAVLSVTLVAMVGGSLMGCSMSYGSLMQSDSQLQSITAEDVQADVDRILGRLTDKAQKSVDDKVAKETVKVDNDIALGDISAIVNDNKGDKYNILEIIPNKHYPMMGYMVGGLEPLDNYALDAAVNSEIGVQFQFDNVNIGNNVYEKQMKITNRFTNQNIASGDHSVQGCQDIFGDGTDALSKFTYNAGNSTVKCSGYMKKVDSDGENNDDYRDGLGGTYAFKEGESSQLGFVSEYTKDGDNYDKKKMCWVWHELDNETFKSENSDYFDDEGNFKEHIYYKQFYSESDNKFYIPADTTEIYFYNIEKHKIYNNELFLLKTFGLNGNPDHGLYTWSWSDGFVSDGGSLSCLNGFYGNDRYETNLKNNTLHNLHVANPEESYSPKVTVECADTSDSNLLNLIKKADLIYIHSSDNLYDLAKHMYDVEHPDDAVDVIKDFNADMPNDCIEEIKKRVNNKTATLAMDVYSRDSTKWSGIKGLAEDMFGKSDGGNNLNLAKTIDNKVIFDNDTKIFRYSNDGTSSFLEEAVKKTEHTGSGGEGEKDRMGEIYYSKAQYPGSTEEIPISKYTITDKSQKSESREVKVIYLNEMQHEKAKDNGLDVFCRVRVRKEYDLAKPDGSNLINGSLFIYNTKIKSLAASDPAGTPVIDPDNNLYNIEKSGDKILLNHNSADNSFSTEPGGDVKVLDAKFRIPKEYFENISVPVQYDLADLTKDYLGDGCMKAEVNIDDVKLPKGNDILLIVLRNTFDLD